MRRSATIAAAGEEGASIMGSLVSTHVGMQLLCSVVPFVQFHRMEHALCTKGHVLVHRTCALLKAGVPQHKM